MSVWEGRRQSWQAGLGTAARLAAAELRLLRRPQAEFDVVLVGYPGHLDLAAARRVARGRPVVFNPLVSLADTFVSDRRQVPPRLRCPRGRSPRSTGARSGPPTSRRRHASQRRLPRRARRTAAGADRPLPRRRRGARLPARLVSRQDPFTFLFVGKLIPLHGLETILAAAREAPELRIRLVGSGQLEALLEARPPNVEWVRWVEYDAAPRRAAPSRRRARDLRHLGQGAARDSEQGVPGARLRDAARHRRHAGGPRAARPRRERAARPSRRRRRPRGSAAPARRRPGARPAAGRRRPRRLPARRRARRCSARAGASSSSARWPYDRPSMTVRRLTSPAFLVYAAMAAYAAGFAALSILRHRALQTGRFDLGNMVQAVWSTAHGHPLAVTGCAATRSRGSPRTSTRSSPLSRRSGSSGRARTRCSSRRPSPSPSARCRSSGSRASTSARERAGARRSRSRTCSIRRPSG